MFIAVRRLVVAVRKISRSAAENQFASSSDERERLYFGGKQDAPMQFQFRLGDVNRNSV